MKVLDRRLCASRAATVRQGSRRRGVYRNPHCNRIATRNQENTVTTSATTPSTTPTTSLPDNTSGMQAFEEQLFQQQMQMQSIGMVGQAHAQTISVLNNMSSSEAGANSSAGRLGS